ncbi:MAG: ECF transporter S component [Microbacterium sp.]
MSRSTSASPQTRTTSRYRWRVVDIVVASIIAVASALIFYVWNFGYELPKALIEPLLPGLGALVNGPWFLAAILAGLVVRKPGAALYAEIVAASISALLGNQWGWATVEAGLVQGLAAEIVFAVVLYRIWSLPVAVLAGAASGLACGINDRVVWYPGYGTAWTTGYIVCSTISGAVLAGALGWLIVRGLAQTGALSRFASGREATRRV